ncbi:hypothetical protein J7U02_03795 [Lactobacillus delbrueckii subsp. lactis]|uniref:hypothetical protein n=1 Tax=Lactobacillus delbrueckii TaxID=1584 RepID=UPI001E612320|nr:hypothetical protein [Lactobacillus delbrueckii]MCD5589810.1 hypothetical protein [Lactobacillus delbrueckii subsp. lactis]
MNTKEYMTNYMKKQLKEATNDLADFAGRKDVDGFLDYLDHPELFSNHDYVINFVIDSQRELIGCQIELAAGGPTTWADTQNKILTTTWNGGEISRELSTEICEFVNFVISEYVF